MFSGNGEVFHTGIFGCFYPGISVEQFGIKLMVQVVIINLGNLFIAAPANFGTALGYRAKMNEPWESCITICNQWAWKPNDQMKSLKQCIQTLVTTAAGNGNLLFNVGPAMDGHIEARQVKRLQEMGDWLKQYGESIYSTQGGPYAPNAVYGATRKGNKIYLHVFQHKDGVLTIPAIPGVKIVKSYFMNGNAVTIKAAKNNYQISLPATLPDENCSVIVMDLDKSAQNIPVIPTKA